MGPGNFAAADHVIDLLGFIKSAEEPFSGAQ
jgi:hypothetical protein